CAEPFERDQHTLVVNRGSAPTRNLARDRSGLTEQCRGYGRDMVTDTRTAFDRRPLSALSVGWFMVIVDSTIINVGLPSIGRNLAAPVSALQWVVDGYIVTFAGLLLSAGWLGDRIGSRKAFLAGLGLFGLSSVGCAFAPNLA